MLLSRLATVCHRRRWIVVGVWVIILIGGIAATPALFGRLTTDVGTINGSESQRAAQAVHQAKPMGPEIYAVADGRAVSDPALRDSVQRVASRVRGLPGVAAVITPWDGRAAADRRAVSRDGRAAVLAVRFDPGRTGKHAVKPAARLLRTIDAPRVAVGGGPLQDDEMNTQAGRDLARAELFTTPVVLVLLLVLFGGLVAAGLPVLIALVGVPATMGVLMAVSAVTDVSVYAVNVVTMLGLGLAVDYALLLVSRFREERARDPEVLGALRRSYATAGRTIAFSGLTVAASLAGLLVFPDAFLRSMGAAGLAVVLLDLAAALTLLPALLSVFGRRIKPAPAVSPATDGRGVFVAIARLVRRRPVVLAAGLGAVLLLAGAPFFRAAYAKPDARSLPASSQSRQLAEIANTRFDTTAQVDPITVVVQGTEPADRLAPYLSAVRALPGVRGVSVRTGVPGLTVIDVVPQGTTQGATAMRLVHDLRAMPAPAPIELTGDAATLADYQQALRSRLPWALGIVVAATFVLLFLFTGSIVVPVKALVMNTLSLGASFGALVWVFQEGHLGGLVGTQALDSLSITTPMLVFAIAFGLSMDYEVFLLGRITEAYRQTGDTDLAVERGLQRTGRIVTAAALLMAVIFAGFVAGGFSPVKQIGLGLLLAIVIDATVVRMLLVPAVMTLIGKANWWAPRPLRRLHDRIGLTDDAVPLPSAQPPRPEPATAGAAAR